MHLRDETGGLHLLSTLDSTDAFWVEGIATVTSDLELSEEDGLMIYL